MLLGVTWVALDDGDGMQVAAESVEPSAAEVTPAQDDNPGGMARLEYPVTVAKVSDAEVLSRVKEFASVVQSATSEVSSVSVVASMQTLNFLNVESAMS